RWSPFATLLGPIAAREAFPTRAFRLPTNVERTDGGYRLQAALPGFEPEDVEVTLENGVLTVSARRSEEKRTEQGRYLRREVFSGSFERRFALPDGVTAGDVQATFENGLLTITIAHAPVSPAVKIPVGGAALTEKSERTEPAQPTAA
ncbi:MAG TPA: Hsp20/alpha crystallin family protein, partial [Candidatus Dormibacteraeota bacterium]